MEVRKTMETASTIQDFREWGYSRMCMQDGSSGTAFYVDPRDGRQSARPVYSDESF
jgi:hypothetical protein